MRGEEREGTLGQHTLGCKMQKKDFSKLHVLNITLESYNNKYSILH